MAAQRAAGVAFCGNEKAQLKPSALRPVLPAANAALEALMQMTSRAAVAISIGSLIGLLRFTLTAEFAANLAPNLRLSVRSRVPKPAHSLHKNTPVQCTAAPTMVPMPTQGA
jgi:hypothetical protein